MSEMGAPAEYTIRHIESYQELEAVGRLQLETWGEEFIDMVPPAILLVTQKIGGIVAGAFDASDQLVAFVYGLPGHRHGHSIHWSHMLAVKTGWRGKGIGRELKLFQRDFALAQGVRRMHWTYDPLEKLNANLNLNRLGALPGEYACDLYGDGESSTLYRTIGTDRFIVTWHLEEEDRRAHLQRFHALDLQAPLPAVITESLQFRPAVENSEGVRIEIPGSIQQVKKEAPERARAWRRATRDAFQHYFGRGYGVIGFDSTASADRPYYIMARPATL
jgi:predicted GNAT superfamily acetyltransferase